MERETHTHKRLIYSDSTNLKNEKNSEPEEIRENTGIRKKEKKNSYKLKPNLFEKARE